MNKKSVADAPPGAGDTPKKENLTDKEYPICVELSIGGQTKVGVVVGEIFHKRVRGSKHFLRRPPAIAFDVASLEAAEAHGARWVRVTDIETGTVYMATIAKIWAWGFMFDRGHGRQIALPLSQFGKEVPGQLSLFT